MVKNPPAKVGDAGSIPGSGGSPRRRKWQPTPVSLPGESHRQRSLRGDSPRGCRVDEHSMMKPISSVQSLSRVQLFVTPWTAAHQSMKPAVLS